jgi:putative membrane protein
MEPVGRTVVAPTANPLLEERFMDRRNAIRAFSGFVAASALIAAPRSRAFAQSAGDKLPPLGVDQYVSQTLAVGTFSKEISQIAVTKAVNPKVRQFGQFEVAEQITMAQALTDLANPPPASLDQQHTELLQQLQAQSGKAFDAAYVRAQITGHRDLLMIQQGFLNGVALERDREHIAMLARTVIDMHLVMLQDLQNEMNA